MTADELTQVRSLLRDAQIISFLKAANRMNDRPTSVVAINEALKLGKPLDAALCENYEGRVPPRYRIITTMSVERITSNTYKIRFGAATNKIGDGGTWSVEFAQDGEVLKLVVEEYWSK